MSHHSDVDFVLTVYLAFLLLALGIWGTVGYLLFHFVEKFW